MGVYLVSISNGRLTLSHDGDVKCDFTANEEGAKELGLNLAKMSNETVIFSSSVDFPEENGGEDIDYRYVIHTEFWAYVRKIIDETGQLDTIKDAFLEVANALYKQSRVNYEDYDQALQASQHMLIQFAEAMAYLPFSKDLITG